MAQDSMPFHDLGEAFENVKDLTAAKILVIDDDEAGIKLIEDILQFDGFRNVECTNNSRGALSLFVEFQPDIVLLDLRMPPPDGLQILKLICSRTDSLIYLPVIVITGETGIEAKRRALSGGATDFITKPFNPDELCLRVRNLLRIHFRQLWLVDQNRFLEEEVLSRTRELEDYELELKQAQIEVISRLGRAAEFRDDDTGQHTLRVGLAAYLVAQILGLPDDEVMVIRRAAPLHDVGKIGTPDSILLKPGRLTEEDWQIIRCHCKIGADLLAGGRTELVQMAEKIAFTHHEKWDGSGYPRGLRGEEIPIEGRIVAVADVFDALVHDRPYKKAWPVETALAEMQRQRGRHFDPDALDAFMQLPHQQLL